MLRPKSSAHTFFFASEGRSVGSVKQSAWSRPPALLSARPSAAQPSERKAKLPSASANSDALQAVLKAISDLGSKFDVLARRLDQLETFTSSLGDRVSLFNTSRPLSSEKKHTSASVTPSATARSRSRSASRASPSVSTRQSMADDKKKKGKDNSKSVDRDSSGLGLSDFKNGKPKLDDDDVSGLPEDP